MKNIVDKKKNAGFGYWSLKAGKIIALIGLCLVMTVSFGFASSDGGHHEAPPFGKEMFFQIFNFILLIWLLVYVYRKNAAGAFEKRSHEIKTAMEEAAEAKKIAEEKYQEYQLRLVRLDDEIQQIMAHVKDDADKEREAILAEAQKQADKQIRQAELTAKQEVAQAKQLLRKEAVELAAGMAADAVKKEMTSEDQKNWVKTYIEKIGDRP